MLRTLLIGFCVLETVAPRRIVEACEPLAFANPADGRLRPWTIPIARLEGIAFTLVLVRGTNPRGLRIPLAGVGLVMALAPQRTVATALEAAYENADDLELRSWVVPATSLLGALYVTVALLAGRADAPADEPI
ncbi:hypothetical protein [Natrarchaeobius oligotrophus]|uniref:Uncharacterized protein n=1 Tax=Natrarchaeobius chitinivorans TaxID=1679083 RepID=A0A3N6MIC0_NATCH|nr:hypothetical protein [Natrarchaeobius chitinivorans]RQH00895.1 hypothetical protein EA472_09735 [Natrarchaeobius chitinivorans]